MQRINHLWKSGAGGKLIIIAGSLFTFCLLCVCVAIILPPSPTPAVPTAAANAVETYIAGTANALAYLNTPTVAPTSTNMPTLTPVPSATELAAVPQETVPCVYCNLECPRNQGDNYFCIAESQLISDQTLFAKTLRTFCDFKAAYDYCQVLVWTDVNYLPHALPMSEESLYYEVADYSRNSYTGYDCFIIFSQGNEIYRSGVCEAIPTNTAVLIPPTSASTGFDHNRDGKVTCADFSFQSEAQEAYRAGHTQLDGNDNDGRACESLP